MIKTKLSQQNMNNLSKFEQKLQQLTKIQSNMYQRILKNQQHTLFQLQESKQQRKKCLKQRPMNIKSQTFQQIIKHPANDNNGNNGQIWMYLANFIQERHDLSQVEKRMLERKRVRQEMERVKEQQRLRQEERIRREKQEREYEQRIRMGKGFGYQQQQSSQLNTNKNRNRLNKKNKVPFNLQRELHRRQVEQNRKRLQRMQQYKRQAYYENKY